MVTIFQPARPRVGLEYVHARPKFKRKVERGAVENRDVSGSNDKAAQAGDEGLYAPARQYTQPVSQRAEAAYIGRSHSADVGCGPRVGRVRGHQNYV